MDKFEKILRDKFQGHEVNMPAGEWEKFSQRLDGLTPKPNPWKSYLVGGVAAATIGISAFFLLPSGEKENTPNSTVVENTTGTEANPVNPGHKTLNDAVVNNNENQEESVTYSVPTVKDEVETKENKSVQNNKTDNKAVDITNKSNDKKAVNSNVINNAENNKTNEPLHNNNNNNTPPNHSVPVTTIQLPEPEISGNIREVCQNAEIAFKASGQRNDVDMTWILNGEEASTEAELKVTFNKPGTQTIQLVYGAMHEGKRITSTSEKRFINVLPAPVAEIEVSKLNSFSPEYLFKAPSTEGNEYQWNFGDGKAQTGNDITHVYRKKGDYNITLTVTGDNGCKSRKVERVEIESDYNLLTPNAFSPNGDGHNDVFISEALKAMPDVRFRMLIFDKSGKKIFETTRLDNPWDGRNTVTGAMSSPDAYVWRVELTRPDGTKEEYMGSVTLLSN